MDFILLYFLVNMLEMYAGPPREILRGGTRLLWALGTD